jgi:hypothetical protein
MERQMKTHFNFDNAANSRALDTQELESVSGGWFNSFADGYPKGNGVINVQWSPAVLPKDKFGVAKPNGWTYDFLK